MIYKNWEATDTHTRSRVDDDDDGKLFLERICVACEKIERKMCRSLQNMPEKFLNEANKILQAQCLSNEIFSQKRGFSHTRTF